MEYAVHCGGTGGRGLVFCGGTSESAVLWGSCGWALSAAGDLDVRVGDTDRDDHYRGGRVGEHGDIAEQCVGELVPVSGFGGGKPSDVEFYGMVERGDMLSRL